MLYQCLACSYQGAAFAQGACPACGSNNIQRVAPIEETAVTPMRKPYLLALLLVLFIFVFLKAVFN